MTTAYTKKPAKDLFEQVSTAANSDFEELKDKFALLPPNDIFILSYIYGFKDAFALYSSEAEDDISEVNIGDIITEIPSGILSAATSGAKREFSKYAEKLKAMQLKDIYLLAFQSGFKDGFETYSDEYNNKDNYQDTIKYYHSDFKRLH